MDTVKLSADERHARQLARLNDILGDRGTLSSLDDLAALPVSRKSDLFTQQMANLPFGNHSPKNVTHIFQSPGPIYEPGLSSNFWRFDRFLTAIGMSAADVVQNTFSYHFTPAGAMFEDAARRIGATVVPTGPGSSRQQAEVAAATGVTTYAGTPDFLQRILETGDSEGFDLGRISTAAVCAGPLFPQQRQYYADRGILCRQCYGTADVGLIAYETTDYTDGMFVDDDVIVEIVSPGTGEVLPKGEIGEVVVTVLSSDLPIVRFSVGDLSALATDDIGDSQPRIVGWRGRADQATKVKGMFIRPEQVSSIVNRTDGIERARVEVSFDGKGDQIDVKLESNAAEASVFEGIVKETLKLRANVTVVPVGSLPRDGILVADLRAPTQ
jgi:phenylacetate-CoA ligase